MKQLPDFKEHNRQTRQLWEDFHKGVHQRVPMIAGVSDRYYVLNPATNPKGVSFYDYSNDPDLMFDMQCAFSEYARFHIPGDHEMGVPEAGWTVNVDFQNYYEAAWYGCQVCYPEGEVPFAVPMLGDDNKEQLFAQGLPDPFGGFMSKAKEYYDRFRERMKTRTILGQRITELGAWFTTTDGPFTVACELRGADKLCVDIYEDPDFYHQLMDYLTESMIQRMKAWRKYMGQPEITKAFGFADDSIMLLSREMYREYVLPYHKRMAQALSTMEERGGVHLCGDATRHFKTLRDELNIYSFDTGFPVDHRALCQELGPEVVIQGGPRAQLIQMGSREEIRAESKRILDEVKPVSRTFIFRDGNDIPPYTPLENIQALYDACLEFGRYE
jgi:uroporphyrinogen-III decarboxylase